MSTTFFPVLAAACFLATPLLAQNYNGVPFSLVAQSGNSLTDGMRTFRSAEITGEKIDFAASNSVSDFALFRSDGGTATTLLNETTTLGSGPASERLEGLFQRVEAGADAPITIEAKVGGVPGYYRRETTAWTEVMRASQNMPGKAFPYTLLGEPHSGNGKLAFIGINNAQSYRGIYIRDNATGAFTTVADSATNLPGIGSFDASSSQVGFDGEKVAFLGIHQLTPTTTSSGIFVGDGGALTTLGKKGDAIPGTAKVIDSFQSPPAIASGNVAYVAFDSSFKRYVYYWNGTTSTLVAKDGDTLPGGGVITDLASYPPKADAGKMVFDAKVNGEAAILQYDGTGLSLVVLKSHVISFNTPNLFIPVDLEGDLLAIYTTIGSTEAIFMNQTAPAKPIITGQNPPSVLVEPGAAVTLEPTIIGQGPLTYSWTGGGLASPVTTASLSFPSFGQSDAGNYRLRVSNAAGSVSYNVTLSINTAPYFSFQPQDVTAFVGNSASLFAGIGGNPDFTYQWFKGSDPTPVSTAASLFINPLTAANAGIYRLVVTNPLGSVTSRDVLLTVNPIPDNPSFSGAQFKNLILDPAGAALGFSGQQNLAFNPANGNIMYLETPSGTSIPKVFSVDAAGTRTVFFDTAEIDNALGETGLFHSFGGIRADGSVLIISGKSSPTRTWIHSYDGTTLTQLLFINGSTPGIANFPMANVSAFGKYPGDPVFRAFSEDFTQNVYFNLRDGAANELFRFTGTLSGGGVTSTGDLGFKAMDHPEFLATADEYAGSTYERTWLIKRDGTAEPIISKNMTVGGMPVTFTSMFISGATADGRVIFNGPAKYQWKDGIVTVLPLPVTDPPETLVGTPVVADGQLFLNGRSGSVYRLTETTATLIHGVPFHDMISINTRTVVAAFGDEVVLRANPFGHPEQVFVNRGAGLRERLPDIEYTYDAVAKTLTITIPDGQTLWVSENLVDWMEITATGSYVAPIGTGKEFFQLRE